ncbi:unnamed protein product [Ostreobium quekettii]|uniref:Uncharacterized protein n=1 Tax=Ostreobium quekettii TaxID=121088 RepID=A0A8S1J2L1_9CHLO|nr:unnamed protein product [Ostreobium quekettii]
MSCPPMAYVLIVRRTTSPVRAPFEAQMLLVQCFGSCQVRCWTCRGNSFESTALAVYTCSQVEGAVDGPFCMVCRRCSIVIATLAGAFILRFVKVSGMGTRMLGGRVMVQEAEI